MHISDIEYKGGLRTSAIHLKSGQIVITDAPPDNNGKGEAFSPTDLLAASLGSCMLTIMGIVGGRHDYNIDGAKVEISKFMGTEPRRVIGIKVEFFMAKNSFDEKAKTILENAALTCPVAKSLHPEIRQEVIFHW